MTINDQPDLSDDQLRALLEPFLDAYDMKYDDQLDGLQGKQSFDHVDIDQVIRWKFGTWPARLQTTITNIAKNSDRDCENLTSRAFRSDDDLAALLLVTELSGVGKALGSAILMARDPARYTVIDVNAAQAIQALGYLRDLPSPRDDNSLPTWDRVPSSHPRPGPPHRLDPARHRSRAIQGRTDDQQAELNRPHHCPRHGREQPHPKAGNTRRGYPCPGTRGAAADDGRASIR
jgi:hypothetical protein